MGQSPASATRRSADSSRLNRRCATARILDGCGDALVVSGLGGAAWDTAAARDRATDFCLWGAMGAAAMMGLGLALARPERRVLVITGDGEMLMACGAFATIAVQHPGNFGLVVMDNECYGETGMQPSHTAHGADLTAMARAAGFAHATTVCDEHALDVLVPDLYGQPGPLFACVKVSRDAETSVLPERHGIRARNRFRSAVRAARHEH